MNADPQHIILKLSHDEEALVVEGLRAWRLFGERQDDRSAVLQIAGVLEGELEARA